MEWILFCVLSLIRMLPVKPLLHNYIPFVTPSNVFPFAVSLPPGSAIHLHKVIKKMICCLTLLLLPSICPMNVKLPSSCSSTLRLINEIKIFLKSP